MIRVDIQQQRLFWSRGQEARDWSIASALNGVGQQSGTFQTPLGEHYVCAKIGEGLPALSVFRGRRWTGEVYSETLASQNPKRDWILSRILWLQGREPGVNRGGRVDSRRRFIYIHGTDEEHLIGEPSSHGCIRMRNQDIIELFSCVQAGEPVALY